jgi:hypothetical protein
LLNTHRCGNLLVAEEGAVNIVRAAGTDFVVSLDGTGRVAAREAGTSVVVAEDTDAAAVIQAAIDALPETGGRVSLRAGCYLVTRTIRIEDKHGVHLEGAGRGIVFSGGREGTVLRAQGHVDVLEIFGRTRKVAGITVSNLHIQGSGRGVGTAGLRVRGDSDLLSLVNVGAHECGIGFHLEGGGGELAGVIDAPQIEFCDPQANGIGLRIDRCHYGKVVGGEFSDCDEAGIAIESPEPGGARTQGIKFVGVSAVRCGKAGIRVGSDTEDITIAGGCDLAGTRAGSGLVVCGSSGGREPRNIIVSGNHCYNNRDDGILIEHARHVVIQGCICSVHDHAYVDSLGQGWGIRIGRGAADVLVCGNLTYGNRRGGIVDESGRAVLSGNHEAAHGAGDSDA